MSVPDLQLTVASMVIKAYLSDESIPWGTRMDYLDGILKRTDRQLKNDPILPKYLVSKAPVHLYHHSRHEYMGFRFTLPHFELDEDEPGQRAILYVELYDTSTNNQVVEKIDEYLDDDEKLRKKLLLLDIKEKYQVDRQNILQHCWYNYMECYVEKWVNLSKMEMDILGRFDTKGYKRMRYTLVLKLPLVRIEKDSSE